MEEEIQDKLFSLEEENAIWAIIQQLSKDQYKNPFKVYHRDEVFKMIEEEYTFGK